MTATKKDCVLLMFILVIRKITFKYGDKTVVAGLIKAVGLPFGFSNSHTHFCTNSMLSTIVFSSTRLKT